MLVGAVGQWEWSEAASSRQHLPGVKEAARGKGQVHVCIWPALACSSSNQEVWQRRHDCGQHLPHRADLQTVCIMVGWVTHLPCPAHSAHLPPSLRQQTATTPRCQSDLWKATAKSVISNCIVGAQLPLAQLSLAHCPAGASSSPSLSRYVRTPRSLLLYQSNLL